MADDKKGPYIKAVVVGDDDVGKHCEVKKNGRTLKLSWWDTEAAQDLDNIRTSDYLKTNVFIVCFDIADPDNVRTKWIPEIANHCPGVPFILVGMKSDLRENEKIKQRLQERDLSPVTFDEGTRMTVEIGAAKYVECSSIKNEIPVEDLFDVFAEVESCLKEKKKEKKKCLMM